MISEIPELCPFFVPRNVISENDNIKKAVYDMAGPENEEGITLARIYRELREDAVEIAKDLTSGIRNLFWVTAFLFYCGSILFIGTYYILFYVTPLNPYAVVIFVVATFFTTLSGIVTAVQYRRLKKKYSRLFDVEGILKTAEE